MIDLPLPCLCDSGMDGQTSEEGPLDSQPSCSLGLMKVALAARVAAVRR